jgi:predicted dinucleotide-binding enzyme
MKIAVIGTGNVGQALGGSFVRAGHEVAFAGRSADKTRGVAASLGATAAATPGEAAQGAEVIVLAVPYVATEDVAGARAAPAAGKVVVDATNPLRADFSGLSTEGGPSGAERFAGLLVGSHVVKAFNTVFAAIQADPATHGITLDALYATDSPEAAAVVRDLAHSIGMRPVNVGPLAAARELEGLAWLNMRLQLLSGGDWTTAPVLVGAPERAVA